MVTQQLIDYINQAKKNGTSDDVIRTTLLKGNWSQNDIDQAFESIKKGIPVPPNQEVPASPNHQTKIILVVVALLAFYPVGLVLMWMWMKDWSKWIKLLLSLPVLSVIGILFLIIIVAINPAKNIKNVQQSFPTTVVYPTRAIPLSSPTPSYIIPSPTSIPRTNISPEPPPR